MNDVAEAESHTPRWYRFRLSSLMLFLSVWCLVFTCVATWYLRHVIAYKRAAYHMREDAVPPPSTRNPWWFGPFTSTEVDFSDYGGEFQWLTRGGLARVSRHLEALPNLKVPNLGGAPIADDDLQYLRKLTDLEVLHVSRSRSNA